MGTFKIAKIIEITGVLKVLRIQKITNIPRIPNVEKLKEFQESPKLTNSKNPRNSKDSKLRPFSYFEIKSFPRKSLPSFARKTSTILRKCDNPSPQQLVQSRRPGTH